MFTLLIFSSITSSRSNIINVLFCGTACHKCSFNFLNSLANIWHNMLILNKILFLLLNRLLKWSWQLTDIHNHAWCSVNTKMATRHNYCRRDQKTTTEFFTYVRYANTSCVFLCMGSPITNPISAADVSAVVFAEGQSEHSCKMNSFKQIWKTIHKY